MQSLLLFLAKRIFVRQKPLVVAVTGSVGKTSTRNAIAAVLVQKFVLRVPQANYNNEFGIPFTIIGRPSPGRSPILWLKLLGAAFSLCLFRSKKYPQLLVLEYGADKPGDIAVLCDVAAPDVAVLTAISPVHAVNYLSLEQLIEEKTTLIRRVKKDGLSVLNADVPLILEHRFDSPAPVMTYGFADNADVRGLNYHQETREDFSFEAGEQFAEVHFDLKTQKETMAANLPDLLGRAQVSAALAAAAVGLHFGLKLEDIVPPLATIVPQNGRMRPLPGIKGCLILDDSYNAAPASMRAALEVLGDFQPRVGARRIAVLGKMAELGPYEVDEHRLVGHQVAQIGADLLITVTEPAKVIRQGAIEAGLPSGSTLHFDTPEDAGRYLDSEVRPGDVVLIKGSQSARLEKVVKDLMADPLKAPELLVRQEGKWLST